MRVTANPATTTAPIITATVAAVERPPAGALASLDPEPQQASLRWLVVKGRGGAVELDQRCSLDDVDTPSQISSCRAHLLVVEIAFHSGEENKVAFLAATGVKASSIATAGNAKRPH